MKTLNQYINTSVENYTFEDYCNDNNILYNDIDNSTHENFVLCNWSNILHRPYYRYKSKIYESILKSYDSKKLYSEIYKYFEDYIAPYYKAYNDKSTIKSLIIKYKDSSFIDSLKFKELLNRYNYFITYDNKESKELHLEPNIHDNFTDYIYNDCNGILYHITNDYIYENKIKKYGLKPKTASYRIFPERVFFTASHNENDLKDDIDFIKDTLKDDEIYNKYNMIVLKVDLKKYKNKISIFKDNTMECDSYWTSEYIPPYCIEVVK